MLKCKHIAVNFLTCENIFQIKNWLGGGCPHDLVLIFYGGRWVQVIVHWHT